MLSLEQRVKIKSSGRNGVITEIQDTFGLDGSLATRYKVSFWFTIDPLFDTFEDWFTESELSAIVSAPWPPAAPVA